MTNLAISPAILERLAGSLLHFVWEGAAIAALTAVALRLMARRPTSWRYAVAVAALAALVAAPLVTFAFYAETGALALRLLRGLDGAAAAAAQTADDTAIWTERIVVVWAIGVVLCFVRLVGGWLLSRRLLRRATAVVGPLVRTAMERAQSGVGVRRTVRLLTAARVESPIVIGWLRPAILLPASALTGLNADQLLAILAHELAHVRRHDYLVNALQRAVECVLFYHPAVWWVSARIRVEREHCADDLAVRVCGDRLVYAQALIAVEKARAAEPALAVPAAGYGLTARVRRILGVRGASRDWQSAVAALAFAAILAGAGLWQPPVLAGPVIASGAFSLPPVPTWEVSPPSLSSSLSAIGAIVTAQTPRPATPPTPQVAPPVITPSREAAREKLGQLRVDYSADSFVKQAGEGDTIAVKTFLAAGMDINAHDTHGFTALTKATVTRHIETVQALLAAGADPDLRVPGTEVGGSALSYAAGGGDLSTMRLLLAAGAKVDVKDVIDGSTALIRAAASGQQDAIRLLLDNKAAIDARGGGNLGATNNRGITALSAAACNGNFDLVRMLIDRGADVNADTTEGTEALLCAVEKRNMEMVRLLLDKGANINVPAFRPPLSVALNSNETDKQKKSATVQLLLDRGADVTVKYNTQSMLFLAINAGLTDIVRVLLEKGLDPNVRSQHPGQETALMAAVNLASRQPAGADIAMLLIDRGADVNVTVNRTTALGLAVRDKQTAVVRALLAKGADPNAPALNTIKPLTLAASNPEIEQLLIDAGAKP